MKAAQATAQPERAQIQESKRYFAQLGAKIAQLRQARGLTQGELGRAIGVSQQAVFAYERGERRTSVFMLIKIAKVLVVRAEELIGVTNRVPVRKRRLSPRAMRHAERLQALSKTQQRFVVRIIDMLEAANGGTGDAQAPGRDSPSQ